MIRSLNLLLVSVGVIGMGVMNASAGSLDSPALPANAASAMWTLNDIYEVMYTRTTNVVRRTTPFAEPTSGPGSTMRTLNEIMALATHMAPVARTGQTTTAPTANYVSGDDGTTRTGVVWPVPRFSPVDVSGVATNQIRDNLTGLIWARDANIATNNATYSPNRDGRTTWYNAFPAVNELANGANYGGANDWRLPTVNELRSLINIGFANPALSDASGTNQWTNGSPFIGVQFGARNYWSSSTGKADTSRAWTVSLATGFVQYEPKSSASYYSFIWPVRGGR